jgi:acetyl esterase/lipase
VRSAVAVLSVLATLALGSAAQAQGVSFSDVLKLEAAPADARITYGPFPPQFGELWLPRGRPPHPVGIVIHGGCWRSLYGEGHVRPLCAALARAGIAAWCLEYRRLGDEGGGWPGTLEDVARGADHLRQIAEPRGLDLARAVAVGHSAGGHLALWLAGRHRLPENHPLRGKSPLPLRGVVGLAPIPDLARAAADRVCGDSVPLLLGGPPEEQSMRYAVASPTALLPLGVSQQILHGREDRIVPIGLSERYVEAARGKGDAARLLVLAGAGHFDLIAPTSKAWPSVERAVRKLVE